jgi:hypothetical protein
MTSIPRPGPRAFIGPTRVRPVACMARPPHRRGPPGPGRGRRIAAPARAGGDAPQLRQHELRAETRGARCRARGPLSMRPNRSTARRSRSVSQPHRSRQESRGEALRAGPIVSRTAYLLYLNGSDLRPAALIDRKRALRELPATPLFLSFCCSQPGS